MNKRCKVCGEEKQLCMFSKKERGILGVRPECNECRSAARRDRYATDDAYRKSILEAQKLANARNPIPNREKARAWALENKERAKETRRKWLERNRDKDRRAKGAWGKRNKHLRNAATARRHASKLRATPAWADKKAIERFYLEARDLGYHVDHIVPLRSKVVCGLHCEANLQILSPQENKLKSNVVWPDMP